MQHKAALSNCVTAFFTSGSQGSDEVGSQLHMAKLYKAALIAAVYLATVLESCVSPSMLRADLRSGFMTRFGHDMKLIPVCEQSTMCCCGDQERLKAGQRPRLNICN